MSSFLMNDSQDIIEFVSLGVFIEDHLRQDQCVYTAYLDHVQMVQNIQLSDWKLANGIVQESHFLSDQMIDIALYRAYDCYDIISQNSTLLETFFISSSNSSSNNNAVFEKLFDASNYAKALWISHLNKNIKNRQQIHTFEFWDCLHFEIEWLVYLLQSTHENTNAFIQESVFNLGKVCFCLSIHPDILISRSSQVLRRTRKLLTYLQNVQISF